MRLSWQGIINSLSRYFCAPSWCCRCFIWTYQHYRKLQLPHSPELVPNANSCSWAFHFSAAFSLPQFSRRARLRLGLGLGTCYSIYLYRICFTHSLIFPTDTNSWRLQSCLSKKKTADSWYKKWNRIESVCLLREQRGCFYDCIFAYFYSLCSAL